jgi:orotidine-5'-phosphate decarboxylase
MTRKQLAEQIFQKRSYLCVGLDTDTSLLPPHLLTLSDPVFEFNKAIIDATADVCVGYKIAKAFFEAMPFDAITVAPYMGEDSVRPFLEYKDKWTIVLGLTSNKGAKDFELQQAGDGLLYEKVLKTVAAWGTPENTMFVVGATQADEFTNIRKLTPNHFYLVPGVGAQGGSLKEISEKAMIRDCGILVNASRAIIYASKEKDFAEKAREVAKTYAEEMSQYL